MKHTLTLLILLSSGLRLAAQDMLIYKDKTVEDVKIIEVTSESIKYREFNSSEDSPIFNIEKDFLSKVIFEGGRVLDLSKSIIDDKRVYADQRQKAIKVDVAGLSYDFLSFSYEQMVDPSTSWEAGLVLIGSGFATYEEENPMGAALNLGFKFKRSPNFYTNRMRYGHIMRGTYIKPNIWLSLYNYDLIDYDHPPDPVTWQYPTTRESAFSGAAMIDFGNQLVFSDRFVVDYAVGLGYGFSGKQGYSSNNYSFFGGYREEGFIQTPLTWSATLKIGYLLGK